MVNFFKKTFSVVATGLRWIVGAILGVGGFGVFFVAGLVGSPFNKARTWAAQRSWTKPLNWLLAPVEWACDMVAFLGVCSGLLGFATFWPEIKGTAMGDELVQFTEAVKANFKKGASSTPSEQAVVA